MTAVIFLTGLALLVTGFAGQFGPWVACMVAGGVLMVPVAGSTLQTLRRPRRPTP